MTAAQPLICMRRLSLENPTVLPVAAIEMKYEVDAGTLHYWRRFP
jgi:hypothetical protein